MIDRFEHNEMTKKGKNIKKSSKNKNNDPGVQV